MNLAAIFNNLDEEQAQQILDQISDEALSNALQTGIEQELIPELQKVRDNAEMPDMTAEEVREELESMSEEEQQEQFSRVAADLLTVMTALRTRPLEGGEMMMDRLRDPWTVESLLLIFDHPEVPDDVVQQQKDFAATWLRWAGANVVPEAYAHEELEDAVNTLYPEATVEQAIDLVEEEDDRA